MDEQNLETKTPNNPNIVVQPLTPQAEPNRKYGVFKLVLIVFAIIALGVIIAFTVKLKSQSPQLAKSNFPEDLNFSSQAQQVDSKTSGGGNPSVVTKDYNSNLTAYAAYTSIKASLISKGWKISEDQASVRSLSQPTYNFYASKDNMLAFLSIASRAGGHSEYIITVQTKTK